MKKRAQGLSVNVIIVAAIALIVLVVLIAIFTGRMGIFTGTVKDVQKCNELCKVNNYEEGEGADTKPEEDYVILIGVKDDEGKQCYCKP